MRIGNMKTKLGIAAIAIAAMLGVSPLTAAPRDNAKQVEIEVPLAKEVRHNLVMLPYYNVFDNLTFQITGKNDVTLGGEVTQPVVKSDAFNAIRRIEGIGKVTNDIQVLPLSPYDNHLRIALYRRIYSTPGLDLYAMRAVPTIHIIVKHGNVTLVGAVGNNMDKNLAGIVANEVPGVFSVTNNLTIG